MAWERNINIKNQQEIAIMREAGRINALALAAAKALVRPGVATIELDKAAEEVIRKHGAVPTFMGVPGAYPYPNTITCSINEELVHGIPRKRKLKEGDIVSIDCGATFEGFVGDAAFTVGVGEITPEAQALIEVTEQCLQVGISKLQVGNHLGDIGAAIQEFAESRGFFLTRMYTGHGVGRQMWEGPQVPNYGTTGHGLVLRAGMTLALEPMLLIGTAETRVLPDQWTVVSADGSLTAHFEHTVAVTTGDPLILTVP
jgi:methionyl aminopeptidase